MKIDISDEELEALITFQRDMRDLAEVDLEDDEAKVRRARIKELISMRRVEVKE